LRRISVCVCCVRAPSRLTFVAALSSFIAIVVNSLSNHTAAVLTVTVAAVVASAVVVAAASVAVVAAAVAFADQQSTNSVIQVFTCEAAGVMVQ
jgi:hypothetical protein